MRSIDPSHTPYNQSLQIQFVELRIIMNTSRRSYFTAIVLYLSTAMTTSEVPNEDKDFASQLQSLKSLVESTISLHEARHKDFRAEHSSMRQKLDVQASKMRQMKDTPEWANELKQEMMSTLKSVRDGLDSRIDQVQLTVEEVDRKGAEKRSGSKRIENIKRQLDEDDRDGDDVRQKDWEGAIVAADYYTTARSPDGGLQWRTPDWTREPAYPNRWDQTTEGPWRPQPYPWQNQESDSESDDDSDAVDKLEELLEREIQQRKRLQRRFRDMRRDLFNLTVDVMEIKLAMTEMMNQSNAEGPNSRPPPLRQRCESGVKSSGQLQPNEIASQSVNFTRPFLNSPHVMVAASMAAEYATEDGAQQASGPVDFHLRKRHVTPQNFRIEFQTSADENAFIFASWMACGQSF